MYRVRPSDNTTQRVGRNESLDICKGRHFIKTPETCGCHSTDMLSKCSFYSPCLCLYFRRCTDIIQIEDEVFSIITPFRVFHILCSAFCHTKRRRQTGIASLLGNTSCWYCILVSSRFCFVCGCAVDVCCFRCHRCRGLVTRAAYRRLNRLVDSRSRPVST